MSQVLHFLSIFFAKPGVVISPDDIMWIKTESVGDTLNQRVTFINMSISFITVLLYFKLLVPRITRTRSITEHVLLSELSQHI
jgi:hypothetical protein